MLGFDCFTAHAGPAGGVVSRLIGLSARPKADHNARTIDVSRNCDTVCPLPQPLSPACGDRRKSPWERGAGGESVHATASLSCILELSISALPMALRLSGESSRAGLWENNLLASCKRAERFGNRVVGLNILQAEAFV